MYVSRSCVVGGSKTGQQRFCVLFGGFVYWSGLVVGEPAEGLPGGHLSGRHRQGRKSAIREVLFYSKRREGRSRSVRVGRNGCGKISSGKADKQSSYGDVGAGVGLEGSYRMLPSFKAGMRHQNGCTK
jgi:hypothetical protein